MYIIYVDNKPVHTCDSWYEAHTLSTDLHSIDEWHGLPIWGNTPEEQEKPDTKRRLRSIREEQIRNEKELERDGLVKFAELVKKRQAELWHRRGAGVNPAPLLPGVARTTISSCPCF